VRECDAGPATEAGFGAHVVPENVRETCANVRETCVKHRAAWDGMASDRLL
jgi:hypothetical protein